METIILDGYNLLHALRPGFADSGNLDRERRWLEAQLETLRKKRRARLLLIYDGAVGVTSEGQRRKGFEVYVSRPPRQADDVILNLCRKLEGTKGLIVVTSDFHDIGRRLHGLPIRHVTSREFAGWLPKSTNEQTKRSSESEKPKDLSADEVQDWLRDFGFRE